MKGILRVRITALPLLREVPPVSKSLMPAPTPRTIARYVKQHAAAVKKSQRPMHMSESVREADYKGHHIVIRTTYDIRVDGIRVTGHMGVTDDGQVHYHPVPNLSFASAVDMVKRLVDVFPDDFANVRRRPLPKKPMPMGRRKSR